MYQETGILPVDSAIILNKNVHPFGKYHCYLNSAIQLPFPILRTISHNFQFNSGTKSWCGHDGVLDDMLLLFFPVWFQIYI